MYLTGYQMFSRSLQLQEFFPDIRDKLYNPVYRIFIPHTSVYFQTCPIDTYQPITCHCNHSNPRKEN